MKYVIKLSNHIFNSLEELAKNIYLYHDEAFALIKSQKFLKFLYKHNEKMYNDIVELLSQPFQQDALIFKVQYILNPIMGLKYHNYSFNSLSEIGKKILSYAPQSDIYLKDLLKYQLLSHYMRVVKFDEKKPNLYKHVLELEKEFLINENRAYFKLGFILNDQKFILYNGKKFSDVKVFMSYVIEPVNITEFSNNYLKSEYVFAYLEVMNYHNKIILFENLVRNIEQKERQNDNLRKV